MVFISLEGFLEVNASDVHAKLPGSTSPVRATPQVPQASVHVVVTPGSPGKPTATSSAPPAGMKRSRLRRAASSLPSFSSVNRRHSNDKSPPTAAIGAKANAPVDQFVLYVTDRDIHHKWVLAKTPVDYFQLKKDLHDTVGECRTFACCGPLRRIVSSSQYNKPKRRWSDSRVVTQFVHSNVIQEYINDLLLAVLGRDTECDSTKQAWALISGFLDVEKQRSDVADRIVLGSIGESHSKQQTVRRSLSEGTPSSRRPSVLIDNSPVVLSDTDASSPVGQCESGDITDGDTSAPPPATECPICCSSFSAADSSKTCRLFCGHKYHADCVRVWLRMQHTCPVCRIPIEGV